MPESLARSRMAVGAVCSGPALFTARERQLFVRVLHTRVLRHDLARAPQQEARRHEALNANRAAGVDAARADADLGAEAEAEAVAEAAAAVAQHARAVHLFEELLRGAVARRADDLQERVASVRQLQGW